MTVHSKTYKIRLVIAGFLALGMSTGILINSAGQFILPIHEDMGYSVGAVSLAFSIIWAAVIISATTVAKFIDRFSPRICMGISTAVLSVMAFFISFTDRIWQFYLFTIIMGLVYTGLHTLPVSVMINRAFLGKKGIATSIAFAGTGIGGMVFNPFFNYIIGNFGWRMGFIAMSVVFFTGGFIILWLVKVPGSSDTNKFSAGKNRISKTEYLEIEGSESYSDVTDSPLDLSGMTCREAVRSLKFALLAVGILISCGVGSTTMMHSVPYMVNVGISAAHASLLISIFLLDLALSKILLGYILDKLGVRKGTLLGFGLYICAIISLLLLQISPYFYVIFLIIGGVGVSTATVTTPILTSYLFGNRDYTRIFGTTIIFNGIGNLVFPFVMGLIFDHTGSYTVGWIMLTVLLIAAFVCYMINFRCAPS